MNFSDEEYVRLYTTDTVTWDMLPWQALALLPLALRKFDRSGVFDFGKHGAERALSTKTRLPIEVVSEALKAILAEEIWKVNGTKIYWPTYIAAQNCRRSERLRKRAERARNASGLEDDDCDTCHDSDVKRDICHESASECDTSHDLPKLSQSVTPGRGRGRGEAGEGSVSGSGSPDRAQAIPIVPPPTRSERIRTEWSDMPIQELARRCRENPHDAAMSGPECRPEVLQVQRAWCEAVGLPIRSLGSLSPKNGALQSILAALAAHSLPEILRACDRAKRDEWAQGRQKNRDGTDGKKCRIEWMSLNVIRRLLDDADAAVSSSGSPVVARMLEAERKRMAETAGAA